MENIIEFKNITKRFGGIAALDNVSFEIKKGYITGLVGENGAGKSTLINICHGVMKPDAGYIIFDGKKVNIKHPVVAEELGLSVVHQEIPICNNLNVATNIFLGPKIPGNKVFPNWDILIGETHKLFKKLNVNVDPQKIVGKCSVGEKQLIAIAKAINQNARLIIFDESTSSLSEAEISQLFNVIDMLKKEGISIIFVSHKLEEIKMIADEVFILKDGKYIGELEKKEINEKTMARMMVGRDVEDIKKDKNRKITNKPLLRINNLNCSELRIKNISFVLKEGEILGLAGIRGAGRTELAKCLIGYSKFDSGEIYIDGKQVSIKSPQDAIRHRIGYLPEDRGELGLFKQMDIKSNLCIAIMKTLVRTGIISNKKFDDVSYDLCRKFNIKFSSLSQNICELSGGNQQKVLLARWLATNPRILILDEPTRGVDVGTKAEIRKMIIEIVGRGFSIILISSEMIELIGIADRILVLNKGSIAGEFTNGEITEENIMIAASMG